MVDGIAAENALLNGIRKDLWGRDLEATGGDKARASRVASTLEGAIPVYLRAALLAELIDETGRQQWCDLLSAYLAAHYREIAPLEAEALARQLLAQEKILLIIDGLDEVRAVHTLRASRRGGERKVGDVDKRRRLVNWLNDRNGLRAWRDVRYVITSRPYGYVGFGIQCPHRLSVVSGHDVAPMLTEQQRALGEAALQDSDGFLRALDGLPAPQRRLLARPLLLALAVDIYHQGGRQLPRDRASLYGACIDGFLQRWPKRRYDLGGGGDLDEAALERRFLALAQSLESDESLKEFRIQLEELATHVHRAAVPGDISTDINVVQLESAGQKYLNLVPVKGASTADFRDYLAWHTGLLLERQQGEVYAFAHRSFQEYLAACDFLGAGELGLKEFAALLIAEPDKWRDVLILACGIAWHGESKQVLRDIVAAILDQVEGPAPEQRWLALTTLSVVLDELIESEADVVAMGAAIRDVLKRDGRSMASELVAMIGAINRAEASATRASVQDRAAAGRVLAWLGDTRPGVGLRDDGLPDIEWMDIEVPERWRRCEMVAGSKGDDTDYLRLQAQPGSGRLILPERYQISRYPVTHAQLAAWLKHGGEVEEQSRWPHPNHPRTNVTWREASAYCQWLDSQMKAEQPEGMQIRLPTEWEWHFAMTGKQAKTQDICTEHYPWGDEWESKRANVGRGDDRIGQTTAVGSYPAQGVGVPR